MMKTLLKYNVVINQRTIDRVKIVSMKINISFKEFKKIILKNIKYYLELSLVKNIIK